MNVCIYRGPKVRHASCYCLHYDRKQKLQREKQNKRTPNQTGSKRENALVNRPQHTFQQKSLLQLRHHIQFPELPLLWSGRGIQFVFVLSEWTGNTSLEVQSSCFRQAGNTASAKAGKTEIHVQAWIVLQSMSIETRNKVGQILMLLYDSTVPRVYTAYTQQKPEVFHTELIVVS